MFKRTTLARHKCAIDGRDVPKSKLQHFPGRSEQAKSVSGTKSPDKKSRTQSKSTQYNHSTKKVITSEFNLIFFCNKTLERKNIIRILTDFTLRSFHVKRRNNSSQNYSC